MNIKINTKVEATLSKVRKGFTKDLFLSLNPPFPPVRLLEFGGCHTGDKVALELNFIFFKQEWVSDIIEDNESEHEWSFVDVGTKLPFFLKSWKHVHKVRDDNGDSIIIDDITFSTGLFLLDVLMYAPLLLQFLYRKPIYKKKFSA